MSALLRFDRRRYAGGSFSGRLGGRGVPVRSGFAVFEVRLGFRFFWVDGPFDARRVARDFVAAPVVALGAVIAGPNSSTHVRAVVRDVYSLCLPVDGQPRDSDRPLDERVLRWFLKDPVPREYAAAGDLPTCPGRRSVAAGSARHVHIAVVRINSDLPDRIKRVRSVGPVRRPQSRLVTRPTLCRLTSTVRLPLSLTHIARRFSTATRPWFPK